MKTGTLQDAAEILEADIMESRAADARVAERIHDGESKGRADQEHDVSDRRKEHHAAESAVFYCHEKGLGGIRLPVFTSKNLNSCSGTAKS